MSEEKQVGLLEQALAALRSTGSELHAAVEGLECRLSPVICHPAPSTAGDGVPRGEGASPALQAIWDIVENLAATNAKVRDMSDRVET